MDPRVVHFIVPPGSTHGSVSFMQMFFLLYQLLFPSQYMAFFEFNDRMEAVMKKAYIYR